MALRAQMRPHSEYATAPWRTPPPPLAEHARTASHGGICILGRDIIRPGDHIATTPDGRDSHVPCIARAGERRTA